MLKIPSLNLLLRKEKLIAPIMYTIKTDRKLEKTFRQQKHRRYGSYGFIKSV